MRLSRRGGDRPDQDSPAPYTAIGHVRGAVTGPNGDARIELVPALTPALAGLAEYSHIIVVFALDEVGEDGRAALTQRPPGAPGDIGVLALRTQARPNPIGVSVARLLVVDGATLRVRGLDAFAGTPVLDIKPYIPYYDSVPDARVPDWIGHP